MRLTRSGFNADAVLARVRFAVVVANRTPLSKPSSSSITTTANSSRRWPHIIRLPPATRRKSLLSVWAAAG